MAEDERTTEEWVFVGRYVRSGSKLGYEWIDATGEHRHFSKGRNQVIGGRYSVTVARHDDGLTMYGEPAYIGPGDADDATLSAWRLADRKASGVVEARRAQDRAMKDNGEFGSLTLDEVRRMMRTQMMPAHRGGLLAAVLAYVEN